MDDKFLTIVLSSSIGVFSSVILLLFTERFKKIELSHTIVSSILTELCCIMTNYRETSDESFNDLKDPNSESIFLGEYYIKQSYFSVFESTSGNIGIIQHKNVRNGIINFYIKLKSYIDTWDTYNNDVHNLKDNSKSWNTMNTNESSEFIHGYYNQTHKELINHLTEVSNHIYDKHLELLNEWGKLKNILDLYIGQDKLRIFLGIN